ncbi:hypothetical protein D9M70_247560 [compost metagenome]
MPRTAALVIPLLSLLSPFAHAWEGHVERSLFDAPTASEKRQQARLQADPQAGGELPPSLRSDAEKRQLIAQAQAAAGQVETLAEGMVPRPGIVLHELRTRRDGESLYDWQRQAGLKNCIPKAAAANGVELPDGRFSGYQQFLSCPGFGALNSHSTVFKGMGLGTFKELANTRVAGEIPGYLRLARSTAGDEQTTLSWVSNNTWHRLEIYDTSPQARRWLLEYAAGMVERGL